MTLRVVAAVAIILLAGVVSLALAKAPRVASSSPATATGYGLSLPAIESSARYPDQALALDTARDLGATWVRFDMSWAAIERTRGVYDWTVYDQAVNAALARGLRVVAILDYNNPIHSGSSNLKRGITTKANRTAFATFAGRAAAHFSGRVAAWEIWNEPNANYFWQPAASPSQYTALVRATYPKIRAADPAAIVLAGALASVYAPNILPTDFLDGMYAAGARGYFDALSHHPYTGSKPPSDTSYQGWSLMTAPGWGLRARMEANGDGSKKIWATEYGATTGGSGAVVVSEDVQAQMIADAMTLWRSYPWAGPLLIHTMRDPIDLDPSGIEAHFGLLRGDWSEKPAAASFRAGVAP